MTAYLPQRPGWGCREFDRAFRNWQAVPCQDPGARGHASCCCAMKCTPYGIHHEMRVSVPCFLLAGRGGGLSPQGFWGLSYPGCFGSAVTLLPRMASWSGKDEGTPKQQYLHLYLCTRAWTLSSCRFIRSRQQPAMHPVFRSDEDGLTCLSMLTLGTRKILTPFAILISPCNIIV